MSMIPSQSYSSRIGSILAILLCIIVAFLAAILQKHLKHTVAVVKKVERPVELTAAEILGNLPVSAHQSDTDKAAMAIIAKVRAEPDKGYRWVALGDVLAQKLRDTADQNYLHHAELAYLRALKLDPKDSDAMTGMAWVMGNRHIFDQSTRWANEALTINSNQVAALGILGDAALELGEYDKAFDCYQKMSDCRPDLSSWSRGAYLLWLTGDDKKAIWLMEKAISAGAPFGENTAWCRAKLAMMYFHSGSLSAGWKSLEPALTKGSRSPHVLLAACKLAAANQDYPAAILYCDKLLEGGLNHEALVLKGDLSIAAGEPDQALGCYQKVMDLHTAQEGKGAHDHMQMARFYADHDRNLVDALKMAEEHKLTHNVIEADTLAWVYFKNGNLSRATETMRIALCQNTPDAEMRYHAGMIAAARGEKEAAKTYLKQAIAWNARFNVIQAPIARNTLDALIAADLSTAKTPVSTSQKQ